MSNNPMTRKEWRDYLQKAIDEFDWDAAFNGTKPWVGLTVEEIEEIGKSYEEKDRSIQAWGLFACAIEDKLKEKNT